MIHNFCHFSSLSPSAHYTAGSVGGGACVTMDFFRPWVDVGIDPTNCAFSNHNKNAISKIIKNFAYLYLIIYFDAAGRIILHFRTLPVAFTKKI